MTPRGRYALYGELGKGGMARVHVGRRFGDGGFSSIVAIKRVNPELSGISELVDMLTDEARIASRVSHANVVATHDVVVAHENGGELFVVMELVIGASVLALLRGVLKRKTKVPPEIARAIVAAMLRGLHAAHEARDAHGQPLGIVHRDISPSNVLVGVDGVARIVDFGIAKAADKITQTQVGERKGKLGFMSPEQLEGKPLDRRSDIWSVGIVFWELLAHERLFGGDEDQFRARLEHAGIAPPSTKTSAATPEDDAIVMRALAKERSARWATAAEMADAIEESGAKIAAQSAVAAFVEDVAKEEVARQRGLVEEMNRTDPLLWIGAPSGAVPPSEPAVEPPPPPPAPSDRGRTPSAPPPASLASDRGRTPSTVASLASDRGRTASVAPRQDGFGRLAYLFAGFGLVLAAVAAT
ncbi:MAG TPA: serine/threonine-protein kinase, partial [Labilithrix sp.]